MKDQTNYLRKLIIPVVAFIAVFAFDWKYMGSEDFSAVLVWWLALLILGMVFQPVCVILFNRFHDNGWMFSKTIGLAFSAWLLWYFSSLKVLKFTRFNCIAIISVCFILNLLVYKLYTKKAERAIKIREVYSSKKLVSMLNAEIMFFVAFAIWCYLKGYNPSAYGTEKFMDYGFITAILKSDYMPAHDLWLSGEGINYYYVGQYISAFFIRVTGVGAGYGYNLMMMTLAAFGFSLPYSIAYNLMLRLRITMSKQHGYKLTEEQKGSICSITGVLSGLGLSLASSMHFPIYKWIVPRINRILNKETDDYWFANATRYIGYNPDVEDKTIHEFPNYSFVLGDLHAHVINIIFVLTVIALLYAWTLERKASVDIAIKKNASYKPNLLKEMFAPQLIGCMFFIGLFQTTNYWDFPIYFVVCGAVILFTNLICFRYKKEAWILTGFQAIAFILIGIFVALPFTLSFDSIASEPAFCTKHTPFYQLMVLWGLPIVIVAAFMIAKIIEFRKSDKKVFFDVFSCDELFVGVIGLCGLGLVLIPEVIYIKDIYGGAYQRANTMFKLTYQAFIMLSIAMPYIIIRFLKFSEKKWVKKLSICFLVLFCTTIMYFFEACEDWFSSYYKTLDSSEFLADESADDKAGVDWINENVPKDAVVLEMCGTSYTFFNRISVFTGNQTVLGWRTHEWLWRSSGDKEYPDCVAERYTDVITMYTSVSVSEVQALIEKYDIDYIYVGEAELVDGYSSATSNAYNYHGTQCTRIDTNHALLKSLGEVVMISPASEGKAYETYIVKVDREKKFDKDIITNSGTDKSELPKPSKITSFDLEGVVIGYTLYEYNKAGLCTSERTYSVINGDEEFVSSSVYTYEGIKPTFGEDFDKSGNRTGFWNYINFDLNSNCTMQHYFAADDSWVLTVNSVYNADSTVSTQTIKYAEGKEVYVTYNYDGSGTLLSKQTVDNGTTTVLQYTSDDGRIVSVTEYINGIQSGTKTYVYND